MSFSAHADAKGIMQLITQCEPRYVLLVHGEAAKMDFLKAKIQQEFGMIVMDLFERHLFFDPYKPLFFNQKQNPSPC